MRHMMCMIKNQKGFTLTEIIVTIMIFSIVVGMLFGFMNSGLDTYLYGVQRTEEQSSLRLAAFKITEEVRNCFEIDIYDAPVDVPGTEYIYLDSATDTIVFSDDGTDIPLSAPVVDDMDFVLTQNTDTGKYTLSITLMTVEDSLTTDVLLNNISSGDIMTNIAGGATSTKVLEISNTPN